jgi:hypothetical protein
MKIWVVALSVVAGCVGDSGALDLSLTLPTVDDLRPVGMTSISVVASSPEIGTLSSTSILDKDQSFSSSPLPVANGVQIDVLFHDDSNRLVGVGEAPSLVDIIGDKQTELTIPVRRPFIYASSGSKVFSYDPTLDARQPKFQGTLAGVTSPQIMVSVGSDRLVVAGTNQLQVIDTATNMVMGSPIAIPGTIHDAAPIPKQHRVAVATSNGIAIVDLDSGAVMMGGSGSVDKVTVGPTLDGHQVATGLVGRVAPPLGPLDPCSGNSSLLAVDVDSPDPSATPQATGQAVADLAAAPDVATLFAALPCSNKVAKVEGITFTDFTALPRASAIAVANQRLWAAGAKPAVPDCQNASGVDVPCAANAMSGCSATGTAPIVFVTTGSSLVVESIPVAGGTPQEVDVPDVRETIISLQDSAHQHAQVLRTFGLQPLDLVVLPGGQYVSLITKNTYYIAALGTQSAIILPCIEATTGNWVLMDMASASVAQRVRTRCDKVVGPSDSIFTDWDCDDPPEGQAPTQGAYMPTSVGALFGAR